MRPPQLSLLAKVVLGLVAVGLIPLGVAAWWLVDLNRDALREQVLRTNTVAAGTAAARVGELLAARRALAEAAAGQVAARPEGAGEALSSLLAARPDLAVAAVFDPAGGEVVRAQRKGLGEEVARVLAAPGGALLADPGAETTWLRFAVPLPGGRGSLRLVADGHVLDETVEPATVGDQAQLALLQHDGAVIAGSPLAATDLPTVLANARSGKVSGAGLYDVPGGQSVLAAFDAVPDTDWFVVSRQPARVAEVAAVRLLRGAGAAVGLALLLTAALSATAYTSVVRPIRDLTRVQRRLAGMPQGAGRGGEIAQLRESFAQLERRLRDKEAIERVFLGRYQVLDVLGQGAMGVVFRGWDPKLQREVALKTVRLDREVARDQRPEMASRLVHEAVTAARFNHPNIVSIYDVEDAEEGAYIAMELIDGETLEHHLWAVHHLAPGAAALVGAAVARALATAHAREVVHQDVKPANVLLGVDGTIKVTDFGISRAFSALTASQDSIFGTPGYVPPEALEGGGYDHRGDLFSLGAVLYHGLTGVRPFAGNNLKEIVKRTLEADVQPPRTLNPDVPPEFDALVMQLLARDPERRASDATAVAERLEAIARDAGATWEAGAFRTATHAATSDGDQSHEPPPSLFIPTQHRAARRHGDPGASRSGRGDRR